MMELADVRDSKSRAARRKGSSPFAPTIFDFKSNAPVLEQADDLNLKFKGRKAWGFESPSGHHLGEKP